LITKADLPPTWNPREVLPAGTDPLLISARTGQGVDDLAEALLHEVGVSPSPKFEPAPFTPRQREVLERAKAALGLDPHRAADLLLRNGVGEQITE
ncbi:MAG: hypothetical protein D6788_03145, partial [Planctomycetota bacterium]